MFDRVQAKVFVKSGKRAQCFVKDLLRVPAYDTKASGTPPRRVTSGVIWLWGETAGRQAPLPENVMSCTFAMVAFLTDAVVIVSAKFSARQPITSDLKVLRVFIYDLCGCSLVGFILTIGDGIFEVKGAAGDAYFDCDNRIADCGTQDFKKKDRGRDLVGNYRATARLEHSVKERRALCLRRLAANVQQQD